MQAQTTFKAIIHDPYKSDKFSADELNFLDKQRVNRSSGNNTNN